MININIHEKGRKSSSFHMNYLSFKLHYRYASFISWSLIAPRIIMLRMVEIGQLFHVNKYVKLSKIQHV